MGNRNERGFPFLRLRSILKYYGRGQKRMTNSKYTKWIILSAWQVVFRDRSRNLQMGPLFITRFPKNGTPYWRVCSEIIAPSYYTTIPFYDTRLSLRRWFFHKLNALIWLNWSKQPPRPKHNNNTSFTCAELSMIHYIFYKFFFFKLLRCNSSTSFSYLKKKSSHLSSFLFLENTRCGRIVCARGCSCIWNREKIKKKKMEKSIIRTQPAKRKKVSNEIRGRIGAIHLLLFFSSPAMNAPTIPSHKHTHPTRRRHIFF